MFNPSLYPKFYNVWIGKLAEPSTIATVVGTGLGFIVSLVVNYLLSVLFVYTEKGNSKTTKGKIPIFQFRKIGNIKGGFLPKMSTVKDKNGRDLVDAEEIKKRWK